MVSFESDYVAGAHPEVLQKLIDTNLENLSGYGTDAYCDSAKEKILKACGLRPDEAQVEFLVGGSQTNAVVISTMLADYEGVIAAKTGHISTHEAGSVEFTGHEVLEIPQKDGKIDASVLEKYMQDFYSDENYEHMTIPGMVYISHPTEYGTLYSKAELEAISAVCKTYEMPLFLDGARLGYGLMSHETDVTLSDLAHLCDVFYIGGTKVGALCGEAVVFTRNNRPKHFVTSIKRRGALLAKGRLIGIQFDALFTDDLYFRIGRYAIEKADRLKQIFHENQIPFFLETATNQQFVVLENHQLEELSKQIASSFWERQDADHTVLRFATSWSTTDEDLQALDDALKSLK